MKILSGMMVLGMTLSYDTVRGRYQYQDTTNQDTLMRGQIQKKSFASFRFRPKLEGTLIRSIKKSLAQEF